jgi:flagellar motor protein MotB
MKKLSALWLAIAIMACSPLSLLRADGSSDPRVKVLLEEALHLYSERQYVRALDLFNQVQRIDPDNKTAKEYIKSSEERISEWENQGDTAAPKKDSTNWDSLLNERSKKSPAEPQANANDLIAARRSLVERMRNRSVRADDIVKISDGKRGVEVVLFHDQLFLPGLQTLRDEALPILDNVAQLLRQRGDREVTITSQAKTDSNDLSRYRSHAVSHSLHVSCPTQHGRVSFRHKRITERRSFFCYEYPDDARDYFLFQLGGQRNLETKFEDSCCLFWWTGFGCFSAFA